LRAIAKENGLDLDLVDVTPQQPTPEYLKLNPLGQVPTFEGADGLVLTESIAISVYLASQNEKTTLLGKNKAEYAQILKWMSFANSALLPNLGGWFGPLLGRVPYNKKSVDVATAATLKVTGIMEEYLKNQTFLVGERISAADFFTAGIAVRGFQFVFDAEWRKAHPNFTRWFDLIANHPSFKAVVDVEYVEEAVKYTPPKKEAKPAAAPKAAAPKKEEPEEEEEAAPAAPKPKHPIEALGKAKMVLDDWKRKYSNEDTRGAALPWFWENYDPSEWSLWKVDYKYNDELTQIFMTSNLIGGFFARLEASRKYIFGSLSVYGESNNSLISGAFLIRGQDHVAAFDVAPDWESYEFTKLDASKPEDKEFIADVWSWDKPIGGKEWADGKVFK